MNAINAAAKVAQEQSRRQNGEFGTQQHSTPDPGPLRGSLPDDLSRRVRDEISEGEPFEMSADDFDHASGIASEISGQGWYCAIEESITYREEDVNDGEIDYRTGEYSVQAFSSEEGMVDFLEGQGTETDSGEVYYKVDHRVVDYSDSTREQVAYFVAAPAKQE